MGRGFSSQREPCVGFRSRHRNAADASGRFPSPSGAFRCRAVRSGYSYPMPRNPQRLFISVKLLSTAGSRRRRYATHRRCGPSRPVATARTKPKASPLSFFRRRSARRAVQKGARSVFHLQLDRLAEPAARSHPGRRAARLARRLADAIHRLPPESRAKKFDSSEPAARSHRRRRAAPRPKARLRPSAGYGLKTRNPLDCELKSPPGEKGGRLAAAKSASEGAGLLATPRRDAPSQR